MNKLYILLELMLFSYFSSKSMENDEKNNKKNNKSCESGKLLNNLINDNFGLNSKNNGFFKLKYDSLIAKIKNIENYDGGFKINFDLKDDKNDNLLGLDTNKFKIYIESEGKYIDDVFLTWKDENDIKSGMTLFEIKKNFLKNNRFYQNSDIFSFSIKLNKNFDINKKIKIFIKYNLSDSNLKNSNKEIIIPVKNEKEEEEFTLFSLIYDDVLKYNELFEIIKNNCFCTSIYGKENSIKLFFPENEKLLDSKFRNLLKIFVEDENGKEINDSILLKWVDKEKIVNNTLLKDIKKSFFVFYKDNKYNTEQKPYQISMFFDKSKYKKVKIKIKYLNDKFFYVKNNDSEIIDLENLEKQKFEKSKNVNNFNNSSNNKLTEAQFKDKFKRLISEGISCEKVGNFKNSLKIKFNINEDLIGESYRNNIKIQYFDEKDNLLTESLLLKWKSSDEIKNNSKLSDIKNGFLFRFPQYPVETIKLFEISMFINKNIKNKKVKIKITYNDEFGEFVKYNNSEILDLNSFK